MNIATENDERWALVVARDPNADGKFYYSVKTSGVYCRPSCPARLARPENVRFHPTCSDAEGAGFRPCKRCKPNQPVERNGPDLPLDVWGTAFEQQVWQVLRERPVGNIDWERVSRDLDEQGNATVEKLLSAGDCRALAALYARDEIFRSRVAIGRHGFGRGEYKYFNYPLPDLIANLRTAIYPRVVPIANRWNHAMGIEVRYPETHAGFLARCHAAGQTKPTPLLLQYGAGDYNCLHQDLYGVHVFPLQLAILLSEPEKDFSGGEFVMTEQRPRMQSRPMVVPLRQGDGVLFAVHNRPVQGTRGVYRVNLRHGVSRVRSGQRHTLGIIFHDAM